MKPLSKPREKGVRGWMEEAFPGLYQPTCTQFSRMAVVVTLPSTQGVFNPREDNTGAVAIWIFLVGATQGAAEKAAALPVS